MIDVAGLEEIENAIDFFAEGNPIHFETMVAEGIFFDFDTPFAEDLREPLIPVAVGIFEWSPHFDGEPEEPHLADYGEEVGDEISADLEVAAYNAGCRFEELRFEYSANNSNNELHLFLSSIPNPRVTLAKTGKPTVKEAYS